ncbi:MAG: hypothetical protein RL180_247, partial [Pseudomonadota bacterium]
DSTPMPATAPVTPTATTTEPCLPRQRDDRQPTPSLSSSVSPRAAPLPVTTLQVLDYRILLARSTGRLNIEHQLTGERVTLQCATGQISGDWHIRPDTHATRLWIEGTPFWLDVSHSAAQIIVLGSDSLGLQLSLQY